MTWRTERALRDRLKRHVGNRLEMSDVISRAVRELLERDERQPVVDDPKRNLSW